MYLYSVVVYMKGFSVAQYCSIWCVLQSLYRPNCHSVHSNYLIVIYMVSSITGAKLYGSRGSHDFIITFILVTPTPLNEDSSFYVVMN